MDAGDDGEAKEPEPQEEEHLRIFTLVERQQRQERMTIIFSFNDDDDDDDDCCHLFVDYIERENTKAIELLFSSSGAHGVEGTAMKKDQNVKDQ